MQSVWTIESPRQSFHVPGYQLSTQPAEVGRLSGFVMLTANLFHCGSIRVAWNVCGAGNRSAIRRRCVALEYRCSGKVGGRGPLLIFEVSCPQVDSFSVNIRPYTGEVHRPNEAAAVASIHERATKTLNKSRYQTANKLPTKGINFSSQLGSGICRAFRAI